MVPWGNVLLPHEAAGWMHGEVPPLVASSVEHVLWQGLRKATDRPPFPSTTSLQARMPLASLIHLYLHVVLRQLPSSRP